MFFCLLPIDFDWLFHIYHSFYWLCQYLQRIKPLLSNSISNSWNFIKLMFRSGLIPIAKLIHVFNISIPVANGTNDVVILSPLNFPPNSTIFAPRFVYVNRSRNSNNMKLNPFKFFRLVCRKMNSRIDDSFVSNFIGWNYTFLS